MYPTRPVLRLLFAMSVLLLLLFGFSYPHLESGSAESVVAVLALVPMVLTLLGSAVLIAIGWEP
jgi:hypothetical protein